MTKPNFKATLSILSISVIGGITTVITGIIPQLKQAFPQVPTTVIEWVVTIANFSALITLLFNPWLVKKFSLRKVVITGLLLSSVTGIIPAFTTNFSLIFLSRILLGLGIGLFSPHAISLIAHSYHGELRARLLGYQTGLGAMGNAFLLGLAGILIGISWQAVFWLHLLLALVAVLVALYVPEPAVENESKDTTDTRITLPRRQWVLIILAFVTYLLIWGVQLKLPSYFEINHFGNAKTINLTLAAMNIGGLAAGLTFGYLHQFLHRYTLTLGYAGAAVSVLALWSTSNTNVAIAAAIFFNFIYSYTGPYLVFSSNQDLKKNQINKVSSYLTIATIISAFFAPLVWNFIGKFGPKDLTTNVLQWIMLILAGIAIITLFSKSRKEV